MGWIKGLRRGSENGKMPRDGRRVPAKVRGRNRLAGSASGPTGCQLGMLTSPFITVLPAQSSTCMGTFIGPAWAQGLGGRSAGFPVAPPAGGGPFLSPALRTGLLALSAGACVVPRDSIVGLVNNCFSRLEHQCPPQSPSHAPS